MTKHAVLCIPPLTLHQSLIPPDWQPTTAVSMIYCTGCNCTFVHPRYQLSHLSQTRNLACLEIKWNLLVMSLVALLPASLLHSMFPTPHHSPGLAPVSPASTNHSQMEPFDELTFCCGDPGNNGLHSDEYTDFSIASDTIDEELDMAGIDDSDDDDTGDGGIDHTDYHGTEFVDSNSANHVDSNSTDPVNSDVRNFT